MWETVELREIRVFLVLAEELHFGRTADRLGLTQSRVSQTLRQLEAKLGERLLSRTSRRASLTPFGKGFLGEVKAPYGELSGVLARTHAANSSLEGTLKLGMLAASSGGPDLTAIIDEFEGLHPECAIRLSEVFFTDPLGPLQRNEIDLMATRLPIKQACLIVGPTLMTEPRVLAVADDHPLAA